MSEVEDLAACVKQSIMDWYVEHGTSEREASSDANDLVDALIHAVRKEEKAKWQKTNEAQVCSLPKKSTDRTGNVPLVAASWQKRKTRARG